MTKNDFDRWLSRIVADDPLNFQKPCRILEPDPKHPFVEGGVIHTCSYCRRDFVPTRYWNRFCGKPCRIAHHRALVKQKPPKLDDLA